MASLGYFKLGTDVYENLGGGQSQKIDQPTFQSLGINYNLLGEGLQQTKTLEQVRDVETQKYISEGGTLGGSSAAVNAGYTFNPVTGTVDYKPITIPEATYADDLQQSGGLTPSDTLIKYQNEVSANMARTNDILSQALQKMQLTQEEKLAQERLLGLQQLQKQAQQQVQERPLDGTMLRGAMQSEIQNISTGQTRESLVNLRQQTFEAERLQLLTAQRQQELEGLKMQLEQGNVNTQTLMQMADLQREIENDYFNKVQTLNQNARESLAMILDKFQGLTLDNLGGENLSLVTQLAQRAGIPLDIIRDGMRVVADNLRIEQAQKQYALETSRINAMDTGGGIDSLGDIATFAQGIANGTATLTNVPQNLRDEVLMYMQQKGLVQLSDTQRNTIDQINRSLGIIDQLTSSLSGLELAEGGFERFTLGPMLELGAMFQTNEDATIFKSRRDSVLATLARATGERGVLTDQDVARAEKALPKLTDTRDVADRKLAEFKSLMEEFQRRAIQTYTGAVSPSTGLITGGNISGMTDEEAYQEYLRLTQ